MPGRVLVGMSGGVDSSVCAALLLEQGYSVEGLTLSLWKDGTAPQTDIDDARRVCEVLHIPHHVLDLKDLFYEKVVSPFIEEYKIGRTPNPCIFCNRQIKFGAMADYAFSQGFDWIATGHYAKTKIDETTGRTHLLKSRFDQKDQSYVLYSLTQEVLSRLLLPLGDYEKEEIRALAEKYRLPVAHKGDSQEICFIPDNDYASFLSRHCDSLPSWGWFLDQKGNRIGRHSGIFLYTIGQRKGLGAFGRPMFVLRINYRDNTIVLGEKGEEYASVLTVTDLHFIPFESLDGPIETLGKIRYKSPPAPCTVTPLSGGQAQVTFLTPQRAVTPGQAVVFYQDDMVLGGGIINRVAE